ncbi:MAG TPA: sigma-70 family RNA polymerase sigma factor [Tepidisphaeraceae bacterium]|jgi:RNA polymerase sigma factor (sigma-70 family)
MATQMDDLPATRAAPKPANKFADLMRDHINLVYSAATRQLRNSPIVDDVVQAVFILLWRKKDSVKGSIAGWLVKTTHFACCDARKLAARRRYHERLAATMKPEHSETTTELAWEKYSPNLDEAMVHLSSKDRDAIALRYLRGLPFKQVALAMGTEEEAAKKRVARAISRLREAISKNSPVPATPILTAQLEARCIQPAPTTLATALAASVGSAKKGSLAAAIVRKTTMRELWLGTKVAAVLLAALATTAILIYFAATSGSSTSTNQPAAEAPPIILSITAIIDGGDVLTLSPAGAVWTHTSFKWPNVVAINGVPFNPHNKTSLDSLGLRDADLSSAQVLSRFGRCTVAMEKTTTGIAIHFSDPLPGAGPYAIKIGFSPKSAALTSTSSIVPTTLPSTPPSADSILLDIKATIDGSDAITIMPQGLRWHHVNAAGPSHVSINGQPWNTQTQPNRDEAELTNADLSSAQVIQRTGRDTLVMEKLDNRLVIYLAESFGGPSQYEIKIRFSRAR